MQASELSSMLGELYDEYWEYYLMENPTVATYLGDHWYDDALEDISAEAYQRRVSSARSFLERLRRYPVPSSGRDRLSFELFERMLSTEIEEANFQPWVFPISQQWGPHIDLPQLVTFHPFHTIADFQNFLSRLRRIPSVMDQTIACMRTGIAKKLVLPRVVVEKIAPQLVAQIVEHPEESEFYKPISTTTEIRPEDLHVLRKDFADAIMGSVVPAYSRLNDFVQDEYMKESSPDPGLWALPDGRDRYAFYVRYHTTTSLSPEQIHKLGVQELSRIHREMREIVTRIGFTGTLQDFIVSVRNNPDNYYPTREALLDGFKQILKKMDTELPRLFSHLPRTPYSFREIEDYRADAAPDAYYYRAPEDGSRPAYFYVNTFKPETRPKHTMEALAYHEAVPGHHLQLAIQQELIGLPKFRRFGPGPNTVFVEGWALYSERLPKELGFYSNPYSDFGRLSMDAWRATRLVVDTGIHYMKWTREQAIRFFKDNTSLSEQNIVSEVDRYIAWPGQALAYKIGQLKILELRGRAEKRLGQRFELRDFHDELLSDGSLPLEALERKMDQWMESLQPN